MTTPTVQPSTAAAAAAREALESGDPFAVIRRYRRATNFLAAAQVYLKSNALLASHSRPTTSSRGCSGIGARLPRSTSSTPISTGS